MTIDERLARIEFMEWWESRGLSVAMDSEWKRWYALWRETAANGRKDFHMLAGRSPPQDDHKEAV